MIKTAEVVLGDNRVVVACSYESPDNSTGWPGSCEVEAVEVVGKVEAIDITELIHAVVAKGAGVWDDLSQRAYEKIQEN